MSLLCAGWAEPSAANGKSSPDTVILTVKSSPSADWESKLELSFKGLKSAIRGATRLDALQLPVTDRYLTITSGRRDEVFRVGQDGRVYDAETGQQLQLSDKWTAKLKRYADGLAEQHYGQLVEWAEARNSVKLKNIVTVMDLETGLQFRAQRRAGRHHADVQPVTREDTKIMKRIYNNQWSWKRRAILVRQEDKLFAASMHGMPHGGDGIPDNGFSGHFCIHFLNSVTHGSKAKDPEHQLMVHKASGRLNEYVRGLDPIELVDSFIAAVHLQQHYMLGLFVDNTQSSFFHKLQEEVRTVHSLRQISKSKPGETKKEEALWAIELPVEVQLEREGRKAIRKKLVFGLHKDAAGSWVITEIQGLGESPKGSKKKSILKNKGD